MKGHKEHAEVLDSGALKCSDFEEESLGCKSAIGVEATAPLPFLKTLELELSLTP